MINRAEKEKEIVELREKLDEYREAVQMLIEFIPEGWPVPLGYNTVVDDIKTMLRTEGK